MRANPRVADRVRGERSIPSLRYAILMQTYKDSTRIPPRFSFILSPRMLRRPSQSD